MFLRKTDRCFPDDKLLDIIYKRDENEEKRYRKVKNLERKIIINMLFFFIMQNFKKYGYVFLFLPLIYLLVNLK